MVCLILSVFSVFTVYRLKKKKTRIPVYLPQIQHLGGSFPLSTLHTKLIVSYYPEFVFGIIKNQQILLIFTVENHF